MDTKITAYKAGQIQQLSESKVVYHIVPDELERLTRAFDAYYFDEEDARPRHKVRAAIKGCGQYRMAGAPVSQVDKHTKAIELLRNGVPVTIVQRILGYASLPATVVYPWHSSVETKQILRIKE